MDANVFAAKGGEKKRNPALDNFKTTLKLLVKTRIAFVGMIITIIYFLIALLDALYPQYLGVTNLSSMLAFLHGQIPSASAQPVAPTTVGGWYNWLGTTEYNIPIFPSILASLKYDLGSSLLIVALGAVTGVVIGTIAGYYGGLLDEIVMRITDIFFSIPFLVFAIAMAVILSRVIPSGSSIDVIIALTIIWWPIYARLSRGNALTIKSLKFVEAATASGSSRIRNVFVHVMPNVLSAVFVQFSLDLGSIVQIFAGLDFIGFHIGGVFFPELGNLLNIGQPYLAEPYLNLVTGQVLSNTIWWPIVMPGIFLLIFTVAINLMGDGLRDVLDPKLRR